MSDYEDVDREARADWLDERDSLDREGPTEAEANQPEPCPMGCGNLTYDPAGGPCNRCWDNMGAWPQSPHG